TIHRFDQLSMTIVLMDDWAYYLILRCNHVIGRQRILFSRKVTTNCEHSLAVASNLGAGDEFSTHDEIMRSLVCSCGRRNVRRNCEHQFLHFDEIFYCSYAGGNHRPGTADCERREFSENFLSEGAPYPAGIIRAAPNFGLIVFLIKFEFRNRAFERIALKNDVTHVRKQDCFRKLVALHAVDQIVQISEPSCTFDTKRHATVGLEGYELDTLVDKKLFCFNIQI